MSCFTASASEGIIIVRGWNGTEGKMRLLAGAFFLLTASVSTAFAADDYQVAQSQSCIASCQTLFSQCLQVCGANCTTSGISAQITSRALTASSSAAANTASAPLASRSCDTEESQCIRLCPTAPNG